MLLERLTVFRVRIELQIPCALSTVQSFEVSSLRVSQSSVHSRPFRVAKSQFREKVIAQRLREQSTAAFFFFLPSIFILIPHESKKLVPSITRKWVNLLQDLRWSTKQECADPLSHELVCLACPVRDPAIRNSVEYHRKVQRAT